MKIFHNNNIQQITMSDERFYFDDKTQQYYPSVTTILEVWPRGFGFNQWLKDLGSNADEVMKRAGDQGTHIHDAIAKFLKGEEVLWMLEEQVDGDLWERKENYTLDEWIMVLKFVDFYKTYKPETIAVEMSLISPELGFGGTLDYVCRLDGKVWYIDWKSGGGIYKANKIQAVAYQKLWNLVVAKDKANNLAIERMGCFHLRAATRGPDKTGKQIQGEGWKLDMVEEPEHLYRLFEYAQAIWKEENPNPKPKNIVYPDRLSIKLLEEEEKNGK